MSRFWFALCIIGKDLELGYYHFSVSIYPWIFQLIHVHSL